MPEAQAQAPQKPVVPSPPRLIVDVERGATYVRSGFLGEGGFARVYEVQDDQRHRRAVKVVHKASIKTKKNKTKLYAEIKLHQMLSHPNIVKFQDCFEDEENVYMVLELCDNGSLMDLLKRRKRYTEAEARYYLVQIIGACQYMHQTNVIHRDLKLGNILLDRDMNVKVGDFGLAALIEKPGDRKKTICGTPNYIAPEVLFDTANGHSFEVDIWSVGVILYTLLIGKPPFQTKDVKAIYRRIRENRYEFPDDKRISSSAEDLITTILNHDPVERPNFNAILSHVFFTDGPFPPYIPTTAFDHAPDFRHISSSQSRRNLAETCQKAKIGMAQSIDTDKARLRQPLGPSIIQQERDFQNAVQPGSPISALLHSARKPLVQAPNAIREPALLRKLSAAGAQSTLSPVRQRLVSKYAQAGPSSGGRKPMERLGEEEEPEEEDLVQEREAEPVIGYNAAIREREIANQKARIVSQMAARPVEQLAALSPRRVIPSSRPIAQPTSSKLPSEALKRPDDLFKPAKMSLFDTVARTLTRAMEKAQTAEGFTSPQIPPNPSAPRVFVVSWLDYCNKYGMGFAMTDGTVNVHFNDSSSLALAPGKQYFDHVDPHTQDGQTQGLRRNFHINQYPKELHNKVYLLKNFEGYMMDRLFGNQDYTYQDNDLTKGMVFVQRYLRMKHVILFRLSNDVLQFNFYDHTKLILSQDGLVVSVIDKHYILRTWSLEELSRPMGGEENPKDRKRVEGVIHKVQYARDVLGKIRTHARSKTSDPPVADAPRQVQRDARAIR